MKFTYSGLKKFDTCPRQYAETKVKKNFKEPETEHTKYGHEVHKALEDYVMSGKPLLKNYQPYQKYLDIIKEIPGEKYPEHRMALDAAKNPCSYDDPDHWCRGIGDLVIINGEDGYYIDYKTGSDRYIDLNQLKLMGVMIFKNFPQVTNINSGLLFVTRNRFVTEEYTRDQCDQLLDTFKGTLTRLEHSHTNDYWPANPSGLCKKHCVVLSCEFNGRA
jgi:hypothetical protein